MSHRRSLARAILWILATIGLFSTVFFVCSVSHLGDASERPRVTAARARLANLQAVLELYRLDMGHYPTTDQGLRALLCGPSGETIRGSFPALGYLRIESLQDPWANDFLYRSPGTEHPDAYDLWSLGADSAPGGTGTDSDLKASFEP